MSIDWDAVTAIAGAVGSLISAGAVIVAALTLKRESERWRRDRELAATERWEAEQALASAVSVVTEPSRGGRAVVSVTNDGDRSVFDVRMRSAARACLLERSDDQPLGESVRRLEPGGCVTYTFEALPGEEDFTRPEIEFVDGSGRRWRRNALGLPQRLMMPQGQSNDT